MANKTNPPTGNFLTRTGSAIKRGAKRVGTGVLKHKGKIALGVTGVGAGVAGYYAYRKHKTPKMTEMGE